MSQELLKILYATDFSSFSQKVRDWAASIAMKWNAAVTALHVVEEVKTDGDPELEKWFLRLQEESAGKLDAEVQELRDRGIEARGMLVMGSPWAEIVRTASALDVDLILVGSHSPRTEGQPVLGSTSHKVAIASAQSVLIVRPNSVRQESDHETAE